MPQRRSPEEIKQNLIRAQRIMQKQRTEERKVDVRWARYALLIIGSFQALMVLYVVTNYAYIFEIVLFDSFIAAAFIALFFHAKKKPAQAITIGLIIYGAIQLLYLVLIPTSFFSGILIKIIIISTLVAGLKAAKKLGPPKSEVADDILDENLEDL